MRAREATFNFAIDAPTSVQAYRSGEKALAYCASRDE
jgi:hypothetical protein